MEEKLREYAKLLIEVGLNVQKGQTVVIRCPVECAYFARLCAAAAYNVGCREVVMRWSDDFLERERFLRADDSVFDVFPAWQAEMLNGYADEGAAFLNISARDPEALLSVDPDRLTRASRSETAIQPYVSAVMSNACPWCVASVPIPSWAKKVFPELPEQEAMDKLWDAIFTSVRISGKGDAVVRWREHVALLKSRIAKLNELHFTSLYYQNSLGTSLNIKLPETHVWAGGDNTSRAGFPFVANMPTEEVFTAPLRDGIDGVVYAALPLVHNGNIIENFHFVIKDGKIVWKVDGGNIYGRKTGNWGTSECPLVYDDKVIYTPAGDQTTMVALNKDTGELIWKTESFGDTGAYVSPILISYKGKRQIIGSTAKHVIGVNPDNGTVEWSFADWGPKEGKWANIAPNTPLYKDGKIFFCHGYLSLIHI